MSISILVVDDEHAIADLIEVYQKMKALQYSNFLTVKMRSDVLSPHKPLT